MSLREINIQVCIALVKFLVGQYMNSVLYQIKGWLSHHTRRRRSLTNLSQMCSIKRKILNTSLISEEYFWPCSTIQKIFPHQTFPRCVAFTIHYWVQSCVYNLTCLFHTHHYHQCCFNIITNIADSISIFKGHNLSSWFSSSPLLKNLLTSIIDHAQLPLKQTNKTI